MSNKWKKKAGEKARGKRADKELEERKELEKRVEEEQKRLLQKKEQDKKEPKQKKGKWEKELSDKVRINKKSKEDGKENIQNRIDYHRFLEQQARKLDYSAMFNYLGNLKVSKYDYSDGTPDAVKLAYRKDETISWGEIKEVTDEEKMNQIIGLNRNFEINGKRESYKWWKAFNKGLGEYLYQISMT